jgi:hypothetical protein
MAATLYQSQQAVTLQTRSAAYSLIGIMLDHLDHLNLNLLKIELVAGNFVQVTLSNPLPVEHIDHLKLTGPI